MLRFVSLKILLFVLLLLSQVAYAQTCGNYSIESGEQCDDGNLDDNDGCSSICLGEGYCPSCSLTIHVEGHSDVNVPCVVGDWSCQAHYVCNVVTGLECIWQSYDCHTGSSGSWYPPDGSSGSSNFNFAYAYDFAGTNYGNICACDTNQMTRYGLASNHEYCGSGVWYRDGNSGTCGNNSIESGEQCDDGNTSNGDGCNSSCQYESVCGNYSVESGEQCDDGNTYGGDGCDSNCQNETIYYYNAYDDYATIGYGNCDYIYIANNDSYSGSLDLYNSYIQTPYGTAYYSNSVSTSQGYLSMYGNYIYYCHNNDSADYFSYTACNTDGYCGTANIYILANATCGNYSVESGEQCDDGNTSDGDGCNSSCQYESVCGNYSVESGEQCDDGNTSDGDGCNSSCQYESVCGNYSVESGEQCDDGNTSDGDGCSSTCVSESWVCGNSIIENGESCDDGNISDGDGCSSKCFKEGVSLTIQVEGHCDVVVPCELDDFSCQAHYVCNQVTGMECVWQSYDCYTGSSGSWYPPDGRSGSSSFNFAYAYDLGGTSYGNICACDSSQMTNYGLASNNTYCGSGRWYRNGLGASGGSCSYICGNSVIESGETCDDGNTTDYDGCSSSCVIEIPVCGNSHVESSETCDDGNTTDYDGCSSSCVIEIPVCGNSHVESGETCDDGNTTDYDGCSSSCIIEIPVCGNSHVESGETCDDGNTTDYDGCSSSCIIEIPVCGNSHVESGETCDDGNTLNLNGCDTNCKIEIMPIPSPTPRVINTITLQTVQLNMDGSAHGISIIAKQIIRRRSNIKTCSTISQRSITRSINEIQSAYSNLWTNIWSGLPGTTQTSSEPNSCLSIDHSAKINEIKNQALNLYNLAYATGQHACLNNSENTLNYRIIKKLLKAIKANYRSLNQTISNYPTTTSACPS